MGFIHSLTGYLMSSWSLSGPGLGAQSSGDMEAISAFGDSESHEGESFSYLLHQEGIAPGCNGLKQFL